MLRTIEFRYFLVPFRMIAIDLNLNLSTKKIDGYGSLFEKGSGRLRLQYRNLTLAIFFVMIFDLILVFVSV